MIDYREIKFEEAIEHHLTHHGYTKADSKNFDRALALDPTVLLPFIRESQPAKWKIIADYHGKNAESVFLEEVTRAVPGISRPKRNPLPRTQPVAMAHRRVGRQAAKRRATAFPMTTSIGTRAQEFRVQLSRRVLVADGAMGTMLYARGVFINRCFDELNVAQPDLVRGIHQEYVKAGAA